VQEDGSVTEGFDVATVRKKLGALVSAETVKLSYPSVADFVCPTGHW
jgi:hypothetical protein